MGFSVSFDYDTVGKSDETSKHNNSFPPVLPGSCFPVTVFQPSHALSRSFLPFTNRISFALLYSCAFERSRQRLLSEKDFRVEWERAHNTTSTHARTHTRTKGCYGFVFHTFVCFPLPPGEHVQDDEKQLTAYREWLCLHKCTHARMMDTLTLHSHPHTLSYTHTQVGYQTSHDGKPS